MGAKVELCNIYGHNDKHHKNIDYSAGIDNSILNPSFLEFGLELT